MKKLLYVTSDKIGEETGAGAVTQNELDSLKRLGTTDVLNPPPQQDPFESDEIALNQCEGAYKLAHFYAGTYSKLISFLKSKGTKITYTAAAHDVEISKEDHEKFGQTFDYPHLTDPDLWKRYLEGYKSADVIICPSTHSKEVMEGYGCKKVKVIPHGCYVSPAFEPIPKVFRVGYLGAVGFDKGLVYLLQAWAKLNYKDTYLTLAGRHTPSIMHLVRQYGGGSIYLAGWLKSASNLYNSCSVYVQPSVCMPPGSLVSTSDGPIAIENLCSDNKVLTMDGSYQKVIEPLKREFSGDLISIRATGINMPVLMTPEHRVFVIKRGLDTRLKAFENKKIAYKMATILHKEEKLGGRNISKKLGIKESMVNGWLYYGRKPEGKGANHSLREDTVKSPEWVKSSELEKGDILLIPRIKNCVKIEYVEMPKKEIKSSTNSTKSLPDKVSLTADVLKFFGYYIAEGYAGEDGAIAFCFHKKEKSYINLVKKVATKIFGLHVRVDSIDNKSTVWMQSTLLSKFLIKEFGHLAKNKKIPEWVVALPKEQLMQLTKAMCQGDGSDYINKLKKLAFSYSTISKSLAYQLFTVLVKLGYMPKINYNKTRGYSVNCHGVDAKNFCNSILNTKKNYKQKKSCPRTYIDDNYYYVPIFEISKKSYAGTVYNLEVENNHCYSVPFIVHNSEGFGCEVIEAMAHGRPVICSDGAGAADCVTHEKDGIIVPKRNVKAITDAIDFYKKNPDALFEHGKNAREKSKQYSWDLIREKYYKLWKDMV